jgi:hypothetical protein
LRFKLKSTKTLKEGKEKKKNEDENEKTNTLST